MYIGAIQDPRSPEEKAQDYKHEELGAGTTQVVWREKKESEWKKFTPRNQDGSGSCGGQAGAKGGETIFNEALSAHPIYQSRSNYPAAGMWAQDIGRAFKNVGTCTESNDPSQNQNDSEMDRPINVSTPFKIAGYVFLEEHTNIDKIAEVLESHKHCVLLVHANYKEWNKDVPVFNGAKEDFGHYVTAVDYTIYAGKKALVIEDSFGTFNAWKGQRVITEDYLKARFDSAMYFLKGSTVVDQKPKYYFTKELMYGSKGVEVSKLQAMMKYEKLFPIEPTGNFFEMTANSLKKWQVAHGIMDFANENNLKKIRFGTKSIKLANVLYGI